MAKAKHEYQSDDVVRKGQDIDSYKQNTQGCVYGIWARKFDPARREMGDWSMVSEVMTDQHVASNAWTYYADHLRGEGAMTAVLVQVLRWHEVEEKYRSIGKYNCASIALDVRSSALLQGPGGVSRTTAPGALSLSLAINRDMTDWIDQKAIPDSDDAAIAKGHDTAIGTADPTPETMPAKSMADPIMTGDASHPANGDGANGNSDVPSMTDDTTADTTRKGRQRRKAGAQ